MKRRTDLMQTLTEREQPEVRLVGKKKNCTAFSLKGEFYRAESAAGKKEVYKAAIHKERKRRRR